MVKYKLEQWIFLYAMYVKNKSCTLHRFCHKYPGVQVPASSTIFKLVNKVHLTGPFTDEKYIRQNAVLNKENPDEAGARSEHLHCKIPDMINSTGTDFDNSSVESD
jgi:hypothetical protein